MESRVYPMEILFLASALLLVYVYVGYPLLLAIWSNLAGRPVRKGAPSATGAWPAVSVIVAVHNEARLLPGRIANLLEQVYPGPLDIVVVSDGSTDQTGHTLRSRRSSATARIAAGRKGSRTQCRRRGGQRRHPRVRRRAAALERRRARRTGLQLSRCRCRRRQRAS